MILTVLITYIIQKHTITRKASRRVCTSNQMPLSSYTKTKTLCNGKRVEYNAAGCAEGVKCE